MRLSNLSSSSLSSLGRLATRLWRILSISALLVLPTSALAAPKVIVISLDGATPRLVQYYLTVGVLNHQEGLGLLQNKGLVGLRNTVAAPSLTAPGHIMIATGSSAANNDITSNTFHLVASPLGSVISGFGAPIGGYDLIGPAESLHPTAEPLWLALRNAGKKVVTATFPGGDGVDVFVPGLRGSPVIQSSAKRTVDYTVPFGEFGGVGARGYSLTHSDFVAAPASTINQLSAAGKNSFSPVLQSALETFAVSGISFNLQAAALDTTDDGVTNYDTLVFFDTTNGIQPGPFALPSTGPAYVKFSDHSSSPFYLENTPKKAGLGFFVSALTPDLSTVRIARYSASDIPPNAPVLSNVNDINSNVGFWGAQSDFRIPEKLSPGFNLFPDDELEAIYEDQVSHFLDYQTRVALRAIEQVPDADLAMIYIEQPDGSEHQFLLVDPRQPTNPLDPTSIGTGQDLAKVARYQRYVQVAYQAANRAVQRIIESVGVDSQGRPNSNIIVVSDHGFAPFHTAVNMASILAANGIDQTKVRAVTSGPAVNLYINLVGRELNGTVGAKEYVSLKAKLEKILKGLKDTNLNYMLGASSISVFDQVHVRPSPGGVNDPNLGRDTTRFIGQDAGDILAMLTVGYNFDGTQSPVVQRFGDAPSTAPILSVPNFYGAHGYDPQLLDMSAIFYAAGPDIRHGVLNAVRNIDIAPTVEKLLGVTPASTVQGRALPKIGH